MTELTKDKAIKVIQNNLEYLDEVIESAIVNLLEEEGIDEGDNDFVLELQYIYDTYVGREKYGK
jgi:hypothetical protein